MTHRIKLNFYKGLKRPWVARIKGVDPRWGFKREFVDADSKNEDAWTWNLETGLYEMEAPYKGRAWIQIHDDGTLLHLTYAEAKRAAREVGGTKKKEMDVPETAEAVMVDGPYDEDENHGRPYYAVCFVDGDGNQVGDWWTKVFDYEEAELYGGRLAKRLGLDYVFEAIPM